MNSNYKEKKDIDNNSDKLLNNKIKRLRNIKVSKITIKTRYFIINFNK